MKFFRLFLITAVIFACVSANAQTGTFTVEQVMSAPYSSGLTAAAKAPRIAWVFNLRGERNVWIADAPAFKAHALTHYQGDDGQQILSLKLTPDGKTALYARGSETGSAGHVA